MKTCLELSIFIFLSQVSLRSVSGQSQISPRSVSGQSQPGQSQPGQSQVSLKSVSGRSEQTSTIMSEVSDGFEPTGELKSAIKDENIAEIR